MSVKAADEATVIVTAGMQCKQGSDRQGKIRNWHEGEPRVTGELMQRKEQLITMAAIVENMARIVNYL